MIQNCLLKNTKTTIFLLDALVSDLVSLNWSSDFIICKKRLDNGKDQGAWARSEMTIMIKLTTNYPPSFKRQSAEDR